jgi:hypothetical protein
MLCTNIRPLPLHHVVGKSPSTSEVDHAGAAAVIGDLVRDDIQVWPQNSVPFLEFRAISTWSDPVVVPNRIHGRKFLAPDSLFLKRKVILPAGILWTKNDDIVFLILIEWRFRTAAIPTLKRLKTPKYKGINVCCIAEGTEAPGTGILLLNLGPGVRRYVQQWRCFAAASLPKRDDEKGKA